MTVDFCNYIRFKDTDGQYQLERNFQNYFIGETRTRDGVDYPFAPFGVTPGAGSKGGDRSDSAVIAPNNLLAANLFREACDQRWLCEITVVLLDPETFEEVFQVTTETWVCSRPEIPDLDRVILRLASPLDAVDSQIPRRTLSSRLVGSLPSSGALSVS
jgi:hypothetical protein